MEEERTRVIQETKKRREDLLKASGGFAMVWGRILVPTKKEVEAQKDPNGEIAVVAISRYLNVSCGRFSGYVAECEQVIRTIGDFTTDQLREENETFQTYLNEICEEGLKGINFVSDCLGVAKPEGLE